MAKDPFRYFRIEARELLDGLSQGVVALEAAARAGGDLAAELERLMRFAHTLKGAAGVVGAPAIAQAAHALEGRLATYADPAAPGARAPIEDLLAILDGVAAELAKLGPPAAAAAPSAPARREASAPARREASAPARREASAEAAPVAESVRLDLADVDRVLAAVADVGARIGSTQARAAEVGALDGDLARIEEWTGRARASGRAPSAGEWEQLASAVERLRGAVRGQRDELVTALEGAERRAGEALEDARRLRLLPAQTLVGELRRVARDAAAASGREVEVEAVGAHVRLDAQVLALVRDALVQIVRNAIAHGIEPPAERARRGKPPRGRLEIRFAVRDARAIVTCADDGRGIDVDGVRRALVERGVLDARAAAGRDLDALMRVAFQRGVTTRAAANELAGRGVGLQLVGHVVDRLRGEVHVRSVAGASTEIELAVPVSVSAAPALGVVAGGRTATIPLDAVRRTLRVDAAAIARAPEGDAILVDEGSGAAATRFVPLARVLEAESSARDVWTVVLVVAGTSTVALGVDRVVGVAPEVVLPLPAGAAASPVVAGVSLDGHGEPRLALDPRAVVDAVQGLGGTAAVAPAPPPRSILVADDSLTSRMLEQSILEAAGYEVTTATSGEEALAIAARRRFDLFVFDVEMPGMTGFELVARTRSDSALAGTPAVLVTSRATPEDKQRGLEVGARAYIVKGEFAQDAFLDAVRRLVG